MKRILHALALLALGLVPPAFATPDYKACKDHPLFPTRMPDYYITDCKATEFDAWEFRAPKGPKVRQEGKYTFITYRIEKGKADQSGVAMVHNYANALAKIGGSTVASDPNRWLVGKVVVDGREVWVDV